MDGRIRKYISEIVERITKRFEVEKIILFGSYAYGNPHRYSDIDLFIQMEGKERPIKRRLKIAQLFKDREVPMDFIVKNHFEIRNRLNLGDPFIKKIMEKGKVLYEKTDSQGMGS